LRDWSAFLKARNCLNKMKLSCRSLSLVGFCWPFSPVADISGWYFGLFPKPGCHKRSLKIVLVWQPWQRSRWFCFVGILWKSRGRRRDWDDGIEVLGEAIPRPSVVLVCASCNCSFTGSFSSNEVSHELISLGSGTMWKRCGSWEGQDLRGIVVSSSSVQSKSRERASATLFSRPGNHWEYSLMPSLRKRVVLPYPSKVR
jgi:hypothetical protein